MEEENTIDWFSENKPKNDDNNGCEGHFNGLHSVAHYPGDWCGCDEAEAPTRTD